MIQAPEIKFPSFSGKEKVGNSGFAGVKRFKPASPKINFMAGAKLASNQGAQAGTLAGSQVPDSRPSSQFNPLKLGKLFS